MAETTYNVTLPHTSSEMYYYSGSSSDWYVNCPLTNGVPICGDDAGNFNGYHFTNASSAKFDVKFYGKSLYIWGGADQGMTVTITINSIGSSFTLTPSGDFLASIDDFTTLCTSNTYGCSDYSDSNDGSGYNYNTATITATQYVVGATVHVSKALFIYPTHRTGATVNLKTYQSNDTSIQYSTGWVRNGTYMQSGDSTTTIQDSKTFSMTFNGQAMWIWQFCGQRNAGLDFGDYGKITLNGNNDYAYQTFADTQAIPQDGKCLAFFKGNLYDQGNTLTFDSEIYNCQIHSIDVLEVSGGTPISTSTTYGYPISSSTSTLSPSGKSTGVSKGVLVAVPVVLITLAIAAGIIAAIFIRKAKKRKAATVPGYTGYAAGNPPLTTPEAKQPEPTFNIPQQTHTPYLMYSPPPPATPAAPALHAPSA